MSKKKELFKSVLSNKKQLFAQSEKTVDNLMPLSETEAFKYGFTLGSVIMIEVLK